MYSFGEFRLDPSERLLLRSGEPLPLTPKVFDALVLLVENAGHLVEKEEFMNRLWPDTFVGEDTLAQNISLLRKALADGHGGPEWIATVPRRGYRFAWAVRETVGFVKDRENTSGKREPRATAQTVSEVHTWDEVKLASTHPIHAAQTEAGAQHKEQSQSISARPFFSRVRLIAAAVVTGTLAGVSTYVLLSPPRVPTVIRTTQITHSGRVDPWGGMLSDGSRLYFLEREGDHWNVAQTSLAGGDTQIVLAPFRNTVLLDLSPDHSHFLIASFAQRDMEMPLWAWPVQGGSPTRIGDLTAYSAAWHPNGDQVVYSKSDGVYLADRDGSNARKFAASNSMSWRLAWSPEGKILRFSSFPYGASQSST
ncbi:MAG TPA: winged helix-turn-helix domain-containing protein [Candidatus Bathyarchaeia archaeon]|nr:winged helix-turn-helix domain-containing protein [Candidatus Bathyarchaeia archaeon]